MSRSCPRGGTHNPERTGASPSRGCPRGATASTCGIRACRRRWSRTWTFPPPAWPCRRRCSSTRAASSGSRTRTSTGSPTRRMRDVSSTSRRPRFGLAWKIFLASVVLIVAVLGATLVYTSWQANRAADASIRRALANTHHAVDAQLDARTRAMAAAAQTAASVPQYRTRLLESRKHADALDQANDIRNLTGAAFALVTNSEGILIARTDRPAEDSVDYSGGALIANALSGDSARGAFGDLQTHSLF